MVVNRQRAIKVDVASLEAFANRALPECLRRRGPYDAPLAGLTEVVIALVSDRAISELHRRFMRIPGPTDVITFGHGEIVISVTTAARQAAEHGQELHRELARYIVHGLLHLNGHEDGSEADAAIMWRAQEELLGRL